MARVGDDARVLSRTRTLRTGLAPARAMAGLRKVTRPGGLFSLDVPRDDVPLRGRVTDDAFEVVRRTQFRNSFTPVARGTIRAVEGGSELTITLSMHLIPVVFLVAWVLLSTVVALFTSISLEDTGGVGLERVALALFPLVGPLVGYALWSTDVDAVVADIAVGVTRQDV